MNDEELCDVYGYAVSASRALAHCREDLTEEQVATLQGERAGYLFRYNELLGYREEK